MTFNNTQQATVNVDVNGADASAELNKLESEAKQLREQMRQLRIANDKLGFDQASAELKQVNKDIKQYKAALNDVNIVMKNLSGSSMRDLTNAQRRLSDQINRSRKETQEERAELARKNEQLKLVTAQIAKNRAELAQTQAVQRSFFTSAADGFNRYFGVIAAGTAAITGLAFSFQQISENAMEFEDNLNNLSAITGLEGRSLDYLAQEAERLSTGMTSSGVKIDKSAAQILNAFNLVGSARPDILKNKEALVSLTESALDLAAASKMELEPATKALTTIMNQYDVAADGSGKVTNILAAASKEGSAMIDYVAEAFLKSGTSAYSAGIPMEEYVGLIEALAKKGEPAERVGTALRNIFTKLSVGADNTNPKIVGLNKALDNLAAMNLDDEALLKWFGEVDINAARNIIALKDEAARLTIAITDTNVAAEQGIKNTSGQRTALAQARNEFVNQTRVLGEALAPAMANVVGIGNKIIVLFTQLPTFVSQNSTLIIALAGAFLALQAAKLKTLAVTIADYAWGQKSILLKAKETAVTAAQLIKEEALAAAKTRSSLAGKAAIGSMAGLRAAFNLLLGPIGLVIAGLTAVVAAIDWYSKNSEAAKNAAKSLETGINAIDTANKELAKSYNELAKEVDKYNQKNDVERKNLIETIKLRITSAKATLEELKLKRLIAAKEAKIKNDEEAYGFSFRMFGNALLSAIPGMADKVVENVEKSGEDAVKDVTTIFENKIADYESLILNMENLFSGLQDRINAEATADAITGQTISNLEEKSRLYAIALKDTTKGTADYVRISEKLAKVNAQLKLEDPAIGSDKEKKAIDDMLNKLQEYSDKITEIQNRLYIDTLNGRDRGLAEIDARYRKDIDLAAKYENEKTEIGRKWGEKRIEMERLRDEEKRRYTEEYELKLRNSFLTAQAELTNDTNIVYNNEIRLLREKLDKQEISVEEYFIRLQSLQKKYVADVVRLAEEEAKRKQDLINKYAGPKTIDQQQSDELAALDADVAANPTVLTEELVGAARARIYQKYADMRKQMEADTQSNILSKMEEASQVAMQITAGISDFFRQQKESELAAAGDNANKRKAIEKKYASTELAITILNALGNLAAGIARIWAQYGAFPPVAAALSAVMGASAMANIATARRQQTAIQAFDKGYYPVTDQYGTRYRARSGGEPSTQTVGVPTVFMAGEKRPEMIIDGATYGNIARYNPGLIDQIMAYRNGTATGKVSQNVATTSPPVVFTDPELKAAIIQLYKTLSNPITAEVSHSQFMRTDKIYKEIEKQSKF